MTTRLLVSYEKWLQSLLLLLLGFYVIVLNVFAEPKDILLALIFAGATIFVLKNIHNEKRTILDRAIMFWGLIFLAYFIHGDVVRYVKGRNFYYIETILYVAIILCLAKRIYVKGLSQDYFVTTPKVALKEYAPKFRALDIALLTSFAIIIFLGIVCRTDIKYIGWILILMLKLFVLYLVFIHNDFKLIYSRGFVAGYTCLFMLFVALSGVGLYRYNIFKGRAIEKRPVADDGFVSNMGKALEVKPGKIEGYLALASFYYNDKKYSKSLKFSEKGLFVGYKRKDSDIYLNSHWLLAGSLFMLDDTKIFDELKWLYNQHKKVYQEIDDTLGLFYEGYVRAQNGDFGEAIRKYESIREIGVDKAVLFYALADTYSKMGNGAKAVKYSALAVEKGIKGKDFLVRIAEIYAESGMIKNAIKYYNKVVDMNVNGTDNEVYYSKIVELELKRNGWQEAINNYMELIKINPQNPDYYFMVGKSYENLGNLKKAIEYYEKSAELDQNNEKGYYYRGYSNAASLLEKRAVKLYKKMERLSSVKHDALLKQAEFYRLKGMYEKAFDIYEELKKLPSGEADAYYQRAQTYLRMGNLEKALSEFNLAYAKHKSKEFDVQILYEIGHVYIRQEKEEDAEQIFNDLAKVPHIQGFKGLGELYLRQEEYDKALEVYEKTFKTPGFKDGFPYIMIEPLKRLLAVYKELGDEEKVKTIKDMLAYWGK